MHSHDGRIGPASLQGNYTLIARSLLPEMPADFAFPENGVEWQVRLVTPDAAALGPDTNVDAGTDTGAVAGDAEGDAGGEGEGEGGGGGGKAEEAAAPVRALETQSMECTSVYDANGYFVDNFPNELFRLSIRPPEEETAEPTSVFAVLRTYSPAIVSLQLLELPAGMNTWSTDQVNPVLGQSVESAERDGVITFAAMRSDEGECVAEIFEAKLPFRAAEEQCSYVLIGRLIRHEPLILMKKKE